MKKARAVHKVRCTSCWEDVLCCYGDECRCGKKFKDGDIIYCNLNRFYVREHFCESCFKKIQKERLGGLKGREIE